MLDQLKDITTFVFDVDGVLTNGGVLVTESGEQLRQFNIKDGYAIQLAVKRGYRILVISGGKSLGVLKRLNGLGVTDVFLGVSDKVAVFEEYLLKHSIKPSEIVYVGDDIPDIYVMKRSGIAVCPADAVQEIKDISAYISTRKGGEGVARDIIEKVLKIQQKWSERKPDAEDQAFF